MYAPAPGNDPVAEDAAGPVDVGEEAFKRLDPLAHPVGDDDQPVHIIIASRERTVDPARTATKLAIYGVLAALIAIPALVLLVIGLFRGLVLLYQGEVWAAWLTVGGIFVVAGALLWARRHS